jgi:hypothetical protein
LRLALAVLPLPVPMIEASFWTLLMSPVGAAPLPDSGLLPAVEAAIALAAITVGAQKKQRAAFTAQAKPWPQNHFAMNRHASSQGGTGQRPWASWQLRTSLIVVA